MDNKTIGIYNRSAAQYADLDVDQVSLKAYRDFSSAFQKIVLFWTMGVDLAILQKNF